MTTILERFEQLHPGSAKLFQEAREVFPDGVTHDTRYTTPFPVAVDRARGSDTLLRAVLDDPALVADVRETARSFREVTGRLARGEGLLGSLTTPGSEGVARDASEGLRGVGRLAERLAGDARFGETLADLQAAMASLRAITARVQAGEGTIGGLVVDPTVYENLAAFLEGAQRSLLLRALIRAAVGKGKTP